MRDEKNIYFYDSNGKLLGTEHIEKYNKCYQNTYEYDERDSE